MKFRDLLVEIGASTGGPPAGDPGTPPGDPTSDPAPESSSSTGRLFSNKSSGGHGLSGQGYLPPNEGDVFLGHKEPQEKHNFKAVGQVGKGIEWTVPARSSKPAVKTELDTEETADAEDKVMEDSDATSTVAGDIAHVAYPLFVKGKTRQEKRKNARAAVGQSMDSGRHTSIIGRGVFEANEAHVVDHSNVIYRLDTANPMDDTEVLVLGGAGRYTLKSLRNKARREIAELSKDLEVDHGGAFRRSSENIKQLTNTLNTIVAAYNQLERIRQRGGSRSRGIRREHLSVVREGIAILEYYKGKK